MYTIAQFPVPQVEPVSLFPPVHFSFSSPASSIDSTLWSHGLLPSSPSPLQASRDVQNSNPGQSYAIGRSPLMSDAENVVPKESFAAFGTDITSTSPPVSESSVTQSHKNPSRQFAFSQKSTSNSPQSLLARTASAHRSARRSAILGHGKQRREDQRLEQRSEQALRMDFMRQRQEWEDEMKSAADLGLGADEDDVTSHHDEQREVPANDEQLTPPAEIEYEVMMGGIEDQWIERALTQVPQAPGGGQNDPDRPDVPPSSMDMDTSATTRPLSEHDDDDYDQLFMDVLSQNEHSMGET